MALGDYSKFWFYSSDEDSITVRWTYNENSGYPANNATFYIEGYGGTSYSNTSENISFPSTVYSTNNSYTFYGLPSGGQFKCYVRFYYGGTYRFQLILTETSSSTSNYYPTTESQNIPYVTLGTPSVSGKNISVTVGYKYCDYVNFNYDWAGSTWDDWIGVNYSSSMNYTTYNFTVPNYNTSYAINAQGEYNDQNLTGSWSGWKYFTSGAGAVSVPPAPTYNGNSTLYANWISSRETMLIEWDRIDDVYAVERYEIQYKNSASGTWLTATNYKYPSGFDSEDYEVGGLTYNTNYDFRVRAVNSVGNSSYSYVYIKSGVPNPDDPIVSVYKNYGNSVQLKFTVDSWTDYVDVWEEWGNYNNHKVYTYGNSVVYLTITGLSTSTSYMISAESNNETYGKDSDWVYFNFTTNSTITAPPADITTVSFNFVTTTAFRANWNSASGADHYSIEVYEGTSASGTPVYSNYNVSGRLYQDVSNLKSGYKYTTKVWAVSSGGVNGGYETETWSTKPATPTINSIVQDGASPQTKLGIDWNDISGALVGYDVYNETTDTLKYASGSYLTFDGLSADTTYSFRVRAYTTYEQGDWSYAVTGKTAKGKPDDITNLQVSVFATSVSLSWNASARAEKYFVNYRKSGTSNWIESTVGGITSTSHNVTGLDQYTEYDFKVYASNSSGSGADAQKSYIRTLDGTKPLCSISSTDGVGRVYFTWTSSDSMSGIASGSGHVVYIASGNTTSGGAKNWGSGEYLSGSIKYKTFTNANGVDFVHGKYYWVRVYSIDNEGNWSEPQDAEIRYSVARPANTWAWWTPKTSGNSYDVKAGEWNSLGTRINQFRIYKDLGSTTFTQAVTGGTFYASMFNEFRDSISACSPTTAPPSRKNKGDKIYASDLNLLVTSMHSIP